MRRTGAPAHAPCNPAHIYLATNLPLLLATAPEPQPEPEPISPHLTSSSGCEIAAALLRHERYRNEDMREQYAEQEAGEAMGRLTRAFVLLCILRVVIAQQQRRRWILQRQHYHDPHRHIQVLSV